MSWFKNLNKGADLHTHFSSLVDFKAILDEIEYQKMDKYLYYNSRNNEFFFDFDREQSSPCYQKDKKKILTSIQNYFQYKTRMIQNPTKKSFMQYKILGNLMYPLIKSNKFYKNYIDLIFRMMRKQNYYLIESRQLYNQRLKLDFKPRANIVTAQELLNYIQKKNEEKNPRSLKIILQFNRDLPHLKKELMSHLLEIHDYRQIIIGVDFTGQEQNPINKEVMEDSEVLEKMTELGLQFYNHGGEFICPEESVKEFRFEDNVHFCNVEYILKHHKEFKELYKRPVRIGHGVVYLQYCYEKGIEIDGVAFEVCPFSNEHFYNGQLKKEIYQKYAKNIVICTDDQNKMNRSLADCYQFLSKQVDNEALQIIIKNSIIFSSLDTETQVSYIIQETLHKIIDKDLLSHMTEKMDYTQHKNGFWDISEKEYELQKDYGSYQQNKRVHY